MHIYNNLNKIVENVKIFQLSESEVYYRFSYALFTVLNGTIDAKTNQNVHALVKGDVILLPPNFTVQIIPLNTATILCLELNNWFMLDTFQTTDIFFTSQTSFETPDLRLLTPYLLSIGKNYFENENNKYESLILSSLYTCIHLMQQYLYPDTSIKNPALLKQERIHPFISFIEKHYLEPLSLQSAANELNVTPQYLAFFCQKNFNCTFIQYINRLKIEKAYDLLIYTTETDITIANYLGFKNVNTYQKQFMQHYQQSTESIRKAAQEKRNPGTTTMIPLSSPKSLLQDYLPLTEEPYKLLEIPNSVFLEHHVSLLEDSNTNILFFSNSWKQIINLGYATQLSNTEIRDQVADIQHSVGFTYGRVCRILDLLTLYPFKDKEFYSFEMIYQVLDFMLQNSLIPFLELGGKPAKISIYNSGYMELEQDTSLASYYKKLIQILPEFITSCCNRYGIECVNKWRFELFYEFNNTQNTNFTFWQYAQIYDKISTIIHNYLPKAKVGGPGYHILTSSSKLISALKTLVNEGIKFDFFSIYVYNNNDDLSSLYNDENYLSSRTKEIAQLIHQYFTNTEIFVTEFNFLQYDKNPINDSLFMSTFIAKYLLNTMEYISGVGYYALSDVSAAHSASETLFFGGNGLYNTNGIKKPSFHIFSFLSLMGCNLIDSGENYWITKSSPYSYQCLFFNHIPLKSKDTETLCVKLKLHNAIPGHYILKSRTLTKDHGDIFQIWKTCNSIETLTQKDIDFFKLMAEPKYSIQNGIVLQDGILEFSLTLNPQNLHLLQIDYNTQ